jgi:cytochrome c2
MAIGIAPSQPRVLFLSEEKFDLNLAKTGEQIYATKACNACHSIKEKKQAMGGSLVNITKKRDLEWLFKFIKDPKSMFKTDGPAKQLLQEYNNIPMPGQGLSDAEVIAIIEYLKDPEKVMSMTPLIPESGSIVKK